MGYLAVFGASIIFSTTTIPMKAPALRRLDVDGMLFALLTGVGIFAVSVPLCAYLATTQEGFRFEPWSLCAAAAIFAINLFAIQAVQSPLGVATGPGIWAGIGMVWSFLLGALAFEEEIHDTRSAALGVSLLAVGVYGVSTSKSSPAAAHDDSEGNSSCPGLYPDDALMPAGNEGLELAALPLGEDRSLREEGGIDGELWKEGVSDPEWAVRVESELDGTSSAAPLRPQTSLAVGWCCCCCVGLLDGALMAPFKLTLLLRGGGAGVHATLCYLASFGLSAGAVSPALYFAYCCATFAAGSSPSLLPPAEHLEAAWLPGLCSGVLWAAANLLSVFGTAILGMAISFPLTQTCALFAAVWGVCYFREQVARRGRLGAGLLCVVAGAALLALAQG